MNLQHLQYIIEIDNCGSISKAAQNLYVSQPYLSKILRETEAEYHLSIFTRGKNGIALTESGRLFISMAKDLLNSAANFEKAFEDRRDSFRLRVVSSSSSHSMDAFIRMVNALPDTVLRFSYRETIGSEVINAVYTREADIGVIMLPDAAAPETIELMEARRISYHKLFEHGTWLLVGEGHPLAERREPVTMEDLYQYNLVLYPLRTDPETRVSEAVYNQEPLGLFDLNRFHQIIYVHNRAALHNILARTNYIGIGTVPVLDQETGFHLVSLPLPTELRSRDFQTSGYALYYIYLKDRELPRAAQVYASFLENYYGAASDYPGSERPWRSRSVPT